MAVSYFLGANSKNGFFSLYDGFARRRGDMLHIIKSGPGTGKSGFMRAIGAKAEGHGYEVQYVLCSGDPASLDGVYIPQLHEAWVDGTAPHVCEPRRFGVDSDYVNLGRFFIGPFSTQEEDYVNRLYSEYRALYKEAYAALNRAFARTPSRMERSAGINAADNRAYVLKVLQKCGESAGAPPPLPRKIFLSAFSCAGEIRLSDTVKALCNNIFSLNGDTGLFQLAAEEARALGLEAVLCPCPLEPEKLEAVLIPQLSLAFTDSERGLGFDRSFSATSHPGSTPEEPALADAAAKLREAKALHDRLESYYIAHMDFAALTAYTEQETARLFG